jgi:hypothetical protein
MRVAAAYFVDFSGLVKRYVREDGTRWMRGLPRRNPSTTGATNLAMLRFLFQRSSRNSATNGRQHPTGDT